jgi:prolyl 4-hydroxylase
MRPGVTGAAGASPGVVRALELLNSGDLPDAVQVLEREVADGSDRALYLLADVLLRCDPPLRDPWRAVGLLEQALVRGHAGAALMLAAIHYSDFAVPPDDRRAAEYLAQAAASGVSAAWRTIGILLHLVGDDDGAERALALAAGGGDHFALHSLAHRAALRGDLAQARGLFRRATIAGLPASRRRLAQLGDGPVEDVRFGSPRSGTGHDLLQGFVLPDAGDDGAGEEQQLAPGLWLRRGLLDPLLCDYLTTASQPWLTRSLVNEPTTGRISSEQIRTSWGMNFAHALPDLLVAYAERRIARCAGVPLVQAEPLAVLRYEVGQEYRPHYDYFTAETLAAHQHHRISGQRTATVVTYIALPDAGGGTEFPRLGITIEPVLGGAIRFRNVDAEGRPDERSLHAGLPVLQGEKWVATLWFRERAVREAVPRSTSATGAA